MIFLASKNLVMNAPAGNVGCLDGRLEVFRQIFQNRRKLLPFKKTFSSLFLAGQYIVGRVPGLEREMRKHITADMVGRIVKAGADGRLLLVNTTNLDTGHTAGI